MDDDSFINPGNDTLFHELPEDRAEREEQENEIIVEAPIIEEAIERIRSDIKDLADTRSFDDGVLNDKELFMATVKAHNMAITVLEREATALEALIREHAE